MLGLALCMWLVTFASHIHTDGDEFSATDPSTACSFCLSLPSGATPPVHATIVLPQFIAIERVTDVVIELVAYDVPSFYLSRGPPVR